MKTFEELANRLVRFALENANSPKEALVALAKAAAKVSIDHKISPKSVLTKLLEGITN